MMITKGLALLGFRILTDDVFYAEVKQVSFTDHNRFFIQRLSRSGNRLKSGRHHNLIFIPH